MVSFVCPLLEPNITGAELCWTNYHERNNINIYISDDDVGLQRLFVTEVSSFTWLDGSQEPEQ